MFWRGFTDIFPSEPIFLGNRPEAGITLQSFTMRIISHLLLLGFWLTPLNLVNADTATSESVQDQEAEVASPVREKVSLQLSWKHQFEFAGFYAAIEKGFYRERGLEVELREYETGMDLIGEVTSGRATYGLSNSLVISERLKGEDILLMANYFKRPSLVFVGQEEIRSLEDMHGKRLMISPKDQQSPLVQLALRSAGLIPGKNLEIVPDTFDPDIFIRKEVDVSADFLSNEPFAYEQAGHPFNIIDISSHLPGLGDVYLFSSEEELRRNPDRARDFIEATNKGWRYALNHPDEMIDLILAKYAPGKSREALYYEAEKIRETIQPIAFPIRSIYRQRLENVADALVELGQVPNNRRLEGFFFDGFLSSADKTPAASLVLTAEEQAWVAANPVVSIGYSNDLPPIVIVDQQGRNSGVLIDYLKLLEQRTGIRFQLTLGSFEEIIDHAYKHEVDMLGPVYAEEVHRDHLILSSPVFRSYPYIYVRSDVTRGISSLTDLDAKRVGYIGGQKLFERIMIAHPNLIPVPLKDNSQLAAALLLGDVDAVLAPSTLEFWRKQRTDTGFRAAAPVAEYGGDVVLGVRNDQPVLSSIIDKGLASISESDRQEILNRWFGSEVNIHQERSRPAIVLTPDERAWLDEHPIIKTGIDPEWAPVEFLDDAGSPQGISVAYLNLFEKVLGVEFEIAGTSSWSAVQDQLAQGTIDLLPAVSYTSKRSDSYRFTKLYLSIPISIFSAADVAYLGGLKPLEGKRVAVVKGYAIQEWLEQDYPELDLVAASTVEEALRWVAGGEAFAFVGNLVTTSYYIGQSGLTQIRVAGETPYENNLGMAVHKDAEILQGILQKALDTVPRNQRDAIYNDWISIRYKHDFDYKLLWQVLGLGVLLLATILFWTHRLSREIARRRQVELSLKKAMQEAELANQVKSEFLANMSHEIRTPMNAMVGVGHLMSQTKLSPQQSEYLKKIQSSSKLLLGIIDNILDFSQIEAGMLELHSTDFDLGEVLQEIEFLLEDDAQQKALRFYTKTDRCLSRKLVGDPQRLTQILLNLAGNAVKFTDAGEVGIVVDCLDEYEHKVRLKFTVTDTGPGIEEEQQKKLFKPFSQVDSSLTRRHGGSGLGLAISQFLAHQMGSEISLDSAPGKGSAFAFEVEFGTSEAVTPEQPNLVPTVLAGKGLHVLLVEDDSLNQKIGCELLENIGAVVTVVDNGIEAIEMLHEESIDLVFMDLQMPKMDGYEAVRLIRKNPAWAHLPVIAMTAHAVNNERQKCLDAGMNDYLTKPVDPEQLAQVIQQWRKKLEERGFSADQSGTRKGPAESAVHLANNSSVQVKQRLGEIYGMIGAERGAVLLEETIAYLEESTPELAEALEAEEWESAGKLAHKMKGTLFVCGDQLLASLLNRVERLPAERQTAETLSTEISANVDELIKVIRDWRAKGYQSRDS